MVHWFQFHKPQKRKAKEPERTEERNPTPTRAGAQRTACASLRVRVSNVSDHPLWQYSWTCYPGTRDPHTLCHTHRRRERPTPSRGTSSRGEKTKSSLRLRVTHRQECSDDKLSHVICQRNWLPIFTCFRLAVLHTHVYSCHAYFVRFASCSLVSPPYPPRLVF